MWRTCSGTVLHTAFPLKVREPEAQRRTKLTDQQVPLPLSALAPALPLEQGTIGPEYRHRPKAFIRC